MSEPEHVVFATRKELRDWLTTHHQQSASIWAVTFKKAASNTYLSREEILDEVLCFGWVDGARKKLDDQRTMQLLSPRKTHVWARTYQVRVEALEAKGLMHKSGLAAIATAKELGQWNTFAHVDDLLIPPDLVEAFSATSTPHSTPLALARFEQFPPSYRRNVLRWIATAKTDATRQKRITELVALTQSGERIKHL
jgi:uncharacterized protein YdeI (YjbR/CyaY-like superfamily)